MAAKLPLIQDASLAPHTRVLLRLDLNVPCKDGSVLNDYRIKRVFPTLKHLSEHNCRTVIISHLDKDSGETLKPVSEYLGKHFKVSFAPDLLSAGGMANDIADGSFL